MQLNNPINLLYCGDRNIENGLALSLLSIRRQMAQPLNVFVFTLDYHEKRYDIHPIRQSTIDGLESYLKEKNPDSRIRLFDCTEMFRDDLPKANMGTRFTPCCMLRLYADLVAEIPDKILYLDYDVVCRKDFTEFYEQDMKYIAISGVPDYYGQWVYCSPLGLHNYLNSGVLLMNMDEIRESDLMAACRDLCRRKKLFLPDQHALNRLCSDKRVCDRKYNEQRHLSEDTVFQHFSTTFRIFPYPQKVSVKPWNVEQLHKKLKIFEYDDLLQEFQRFKESINL